jgi:hypothetical protein
MYGGSEHENKKKTPKRNSKISVCKGKVLVNFFFVLVYFNGDNIDKDVSTIKNLYN